MTRRVYWEWEGLKRIDPEKAKKLVDRILEIVDNPKLAIPDEDMRGLLWRSLELEYWGQSKMITEKEVRQEFAYFLARVLRGGFKKE